jgi:hypothetical protein
MSTTYVVEWTLNNCRSMEAFASMDAAKRFSVLVADMRPQIHELATRTETFLQAMGLPCAVRDGRCQSGGECQELGQCDPYACGCPAGMCASKPQGCRMADEVRRNAGAQ